MRRFLGVFLAVSLLLPEFLPAQNDTSQPATNNSASPNPAPANAQATPTQSVRPQSRSRRHSYERETRQRRHSRISKKEVAFMAAIAGTSMGIGAIAGGGEGLAIGAIVGGWGAYAGHRLWKWLK
jgi:hypothetical protein